MAARMVAVIAIHPQLLLYAGDLTIEGAQFRIGETAAGVLYPQVLDLPDLTVQLAGFGGGATAGASQQVCRR